MARKAIVLAAGFGTRLRPLTATVPKPLLPIWGVPMLERVIEDLREWGVDDVVVNAHHLADAVEAWAKDYSAACGEGFSLRVSRESEILGTGGVLNPLRDWIGGEDFYLVNGDIAFATGFRFPAGPDSAGVIGSCLLTVEGPRTVEIEPSRGLVTCWKSPDPGWDGTFTYCGVARLSAKILDYVRPEGFSTIVDAYEKAMADGFFIRGFVPEDLSWADAGLVDGYLALNENGEENAFADIPQVASAIRALAPSEGELRHVAFMGNRGSDRAFFRLSFARRDAVAIVYDDAKRAENARYAGHARWLAAKGIPVPEVMADLPESKTLALEYAGPADLAARSAKAGPRAVESYVPVVETLAKFNALAAESDLPALEAPFDATLWAWERELFREHCLGARFHRECPEAVLRELAEVERRLAGEPRALVHRDFQSTNVMWKNDRFTFIDFQGMRLGPAAYDLASILYDPYVAVTEGERRALAALYGKTCGRPEIVGTLPFAAVQRLCQALGAYGRLASVGQPQFSRHVLPALQNLLLAADEAGLDAIGALAEDLIAEETRNAEAVRGHGKCACGHEHGHGQKHGRCACGHDHGHD